jgi:soluble lytic murein transglycosylase-like protein
MFPTLTPQMQQAVVAAAQRSGMPPALLANHLWNESRGNPNTPAGDNGASFGTMQMQAPTLADYNAKHSTNYTTGDISDPTRPEVGVAVGAQHWADMRDRYGGNPRYASLAYGSGPRKTDSWINAGADWSKLPPQVREIMGNIYGPSDFPGATPTPEAVKTAQHAAATAAADPFSAAFAGKPAATAPAIVPGGLGRSDYPARPTDGATDAPVCAGILWRGPAR